MTKKARVTSRYSSAKFAEFVARANVSALYTHDVVELEQRQFVRLFIYDELMFGPKWEGLVNPHAARVCTAFTTENFSVYKKGTGIDAEVLALPEEHSYTFWQYEGRSNEKVLRKVPFLPIKGSLCAVEGSHMKLLDTFYENGYPYIRTRVRVVIPNYQWRWDEPLVNKTWREVQLNFVWAYMYVANPDWWNDEINDGEFAPIRSFVSRTPSIPRYYEHTKLEYIPL